MSPLTSARAAIVEDLAAGLRHFRILARIAARDPVALGILIFAGSVTIPAWTFGLGIDLLIAELPGRARAQHPAGSALRFPSRTRRPSRTWRVTS